MIPLLTREQMRAFDAAAIEAGVPSVVLMENAGKNAAAVIAEHLEESGGTRALVLAGPGNNGGDGYVVARHLAADGFDVRVLSTTAPDALRGDAQHQAAAWRAVGGTVEDVSGDDGMTIVRDALSELDDGDVAIDALLGTGLDRPVRGRIGDVIAAVDDAGVDVVALDVPSGIDANTGAVLGVAIRAVLTVTFAHLKCGLFTSTGAEHAGVVERVDIGVPDDLPESVESAAWVVESDDVAEHVSFRSVSTHKNKAGHVVVVAGSPGKIGAALLVARGALRAGAGLCTLASRPEAATALEQRVLEEMTARIDPARVEASLDEVLARANAVVIGPGLGLDDVAHAIVQHVVMNWDGVKVVDADALSCIAERGLDLTKARGQLVLTPHPGEMGRLLKISAGDVETDRFSALERAVRLTGAVVLLKGPRTLIGAPGEAPLVNASGTPALATAGSGDVLAGVLGALCCSMPPRAAAMTAAHVHGLAAERWGAQHGADRGLLAHEVADGVPGVLAGLAAGVSP